MSTRKFISLVLLATMILACTPLPTQTGTPPTLQSPPTAGLPPTEETPLASLQPLPVHVGYGAAGTWFEIYFTDPSNPASPQQSGGVEEAVIASIDSARLSIDVAFYSLSLREIANALLRARDRGVQVRVVMESDNRERSVPQALIDGGIPILGDRREGLMHDKFIIIDHSEVWMGSMNYTTSGAYNDNNNTIHLRSVKIAENYSVEFEEMYTEDLFSTDSLAATPHSTLTIDGMDVENYFSPDDGVAARIAELVSGAQESVYFMAYSFTSDVIGQAVRERFASGVTVMGVVDESQVASNQGTEFDPFAQAGIDVRMDGISGLMHHKVIIIDGRIVITGSYNFTASAEDRNDENIFIFYSAEIAEFFMAEFQRVFALAPHP